MPTVNELRQRDGDPPITMLTAYDAPTAGIIDSVGIDAILVGDSMGNTVLGYDSTLPVTVEEMANRTRTVANAAEEAVVIADLPFLSYGVEEAESIRNAGRMLKEEGADAVKFECGPHTIELTERLVELGIPVQAHLGLTPQHVNVLGGYRRQGTESAAAERMQELAEAHEAAGAFSLVLENVPANLAAAITESLDIPTIGIGAGPETTGQVLVITDVIGLSDWSPSFARQYADVGSEIEAAVSAFHEEVRAGEFPAEEHSHIEENLDV